MNARGRAAALAAVTVAVAAGAVMAFAGSEDEPTRDACAGAGPSVKDMPAEAGGDTIRRDARAACRTVARNAVRITPTTPGPRDPIKVSYALAKPLEPGAALRVSLLITDRRIIEGCSRLIVASSNRSRGVITLDPAAGDGTLPMPRRRWCSGSMSISGVIASVGASDTVVFQADGQSTE